ncbi:MAG: histidine phosphatase family protein [Kiritimatiellae bacterium]|nr:histidine phosphatase family protein [Kiritimatiellia bacterium]
MRLYLIRHGHPDYSTDSLTPRGKGEAQALSEYLSTLNLDRIYTSPMGRARETASFTSAKTGIPPVVLDWTAELRLRACDGTDFPAWEMSPENLRRPEFQEPPSWMPALNQLAGESDAWVESLGWRRDGISYVHMPERGVPKQI